MSPWFKEELVKRLAHAGQTRQSTLSAKRAYQIIPTGSTFSLHEGDFQIDGFGTHFLFARNFVEICSQFERMRYLSIDNISNISQVFKTTVKSLDSSASAQTCLLVVFGIDQENFAELLPFTFQEIYDSLVFIFVSDKPILHSDVEILEFSSSACEISSPPDDFDVPDFDTEDNSTSRSSIQPLPFPSSLDLDNTDLLALMSFWIDADSLKQCQQLAELFSSVAGFSWVQSTSACDDLEPQPSVFTDVTAALKIFKKILSLSDQDHSAIQNACLSTNIKNQVWKFLATHESFTSNLNQIGEYWVRKCSHLNATRTLYISIPLWHLQNIMFEYHILPGLQEERESISVLVLNCYLNVCLELLRSLHELHIYVMVQDVHKHLEYILEHKIDLTQSLLLQCLISIIPIWEKSRTLESLTKDKDFRNSRSEYLMLFSKLIQFLELFSPLQNAPSIDISDAPSRPSSGSHHHASEHIDIDIDEGPTVPCSVNRFMDIDDVVPQGEGDDHDSDSDEDDDTAPRISRDRILSLFDRLETVLPTLDSSLKILFMEALYMLGRCSKFLSRSFSRNLSLSLLTRIYSILDDDEMKEKGFWLMISGRLLQLQSDLNIITNPISKAENITAMLITKFGHDDPRICPGLDEEAEVRNHQGDIQGMFDKAFESLQLKEKYLGLQSLETARGYHTVANAAGGLGELKKQQTFLAKARSIKVELFGEEHIETWIVDVSLANSLSAVGKFDEMKRHIEILIPKFEAFYGKIHVQVARLYDSLANACGALGDVLKMKEHLEISLEIKRSLLGDKSIQTVNTYHILANCNGLLGKPEEQRRLLEKKVIPIFKKQYGDDHVQLASAYQDLGNAYGNLGKSEKKLELLERAYQINLAYYKKEDHFQMANILHNLANAAGDTGDLQRKKNLLEKAYEIKKNHFGEHHTQTANTLQNLGNAYGALGDLDMMEKLLKKSHEIMLKSLGPDHVQTATVMHNLAHCLGARLKYVEMEKILKQVLPIFRKYYGDDNLLVSHVLHGLAMSQYGLIKKLQQLVSQVKPDQRHDILMQLESLSIAKLDQAKSKITALYKNCKEYVKRAIEIRETRLGPEHSQCRTSKHLQSKSDQRYTSCVKAFTHFFEHQRKPSLAQEDLDSSSSSRRKSEDQNPDLKRAKRDFELN